MQYDKKFTRNFIKASNSTQSSDSESDTEKQMVDRNSHGILIAHGKMDEIVPYSMGQQLVNAIKWCKVKFLSSDTASHNNIFNFKKEIMNPIFRQILAAARPKELVQELQRTSKL